MNQKHAAGKEARAELLAGVNLLATAVSATLGPSGRNVIIQQHPGRPPHVTKDGVTVARSINSNKPLERAALMLVRQVASKTAEIAGDGTTTATVIAKDLIDSGLPMVEAGANAIQLQRGIAHGAELIAIALSEMSVPVAGVEELQRVATLSANSDSEIGAKIAEAIEKVTVDGLITVEEGTTKQTEVIVHKGYVVDNGYIDPVFAVVKGEMKPKVMYTNASVIITNRTISRLTALIPVLESALSDGKPLVIFAANVVDEALRMLVENHLKGAARILVVRVSGFGSDLDSDLANLAAITGSKVIGAELESASVADLQLSIGTAASIEASRDRTIIRPAIKSDEAMPESLMKRVATLQNHIRSTDSEFLREKSKESLSKLAARVATIRVGGDTEAHVKEKIDRYDDALHATRAAAAEGIIPGGGVSLMRAAALVKNSLDTVGIVRDAVNTPARHADFETGIQLVLQAALAPFKQIASNSGMDAAELLLKIDQGSGSQDGVDFLTGSVVNMFEAGILDPTKVTKTALHCAAEVAGLLLTTEFIMAPDIE